MILGWFDFVVLGFAFLWVIGAGLGQYKDYLQRTEKERKLNWLEKLK
jgi:hypothetical protein